jgi:PST family polysaccharide transporter
VIYLGRSNALAGTVLTKNKGHHRLYTIRRLVQRNLFHNLVALYFLQAANYLLPFITVPYLTRVLGPTNWGLLAFTQSLVVYFGIVLEFGFNFTATREVARHRENREMRSDLMAGVLGAKCVLASLCLCLAVVLQQCIGSFKSAPFILWAAMFAVVCQAFNPVWYFQGLERMRLVAGMDIGARTLATVGIFALVRNPAHVWRVFLAQGAGSLVSVALGLHLAYKDISLRLPKWRLVWSSLRSGAVIFLYRGAESLYTTGNVFMLGLLASPQAVAYYAGSEKIRRAVLGVYGPINIALFPHISGLVGKSKDDAARLFRLSLVVMVTLGILISLGVIAFTPSIVSLLLGPGYEQAVTPLRILALLIPVVAVGNVLGLQWMLPSGMDREFTLTIFAAAAANLLVVFVAASRFEAVGMAVATAVSEICVALGFAFVLRRRDPHLFSPRVKGVSGQSWEINV